ncbi:MAG TPA: glycosyltransferase family 2 protein [Candidatus Saccharimonadales bacterium]|nr:glycosyltransferase family 2 protein [Candidatus Saccharimonadales bacterium]
MALLKAQAANHLLQSGNGWQVTGGDPHFYIVDSMNAKLELTAGWYRFAIEFTEKSGELHAPRLYPNFGAGFAEETSLDLTPFRTGKGLEGLVRLDRDITALRFDPTVEACEFVLGNIELSKLNKLSALRCMMMKMYGEGVSFSTIIKEIIARFREGGVRRVGEYIYNQYCYLLYSNGGRSDYASWVERYDILHDSDRSAIRERISQLSCRPLISLVLPVYNTPEKWLRRCLDTVLSQLYPHWELCIADDASPQPHVRKVLEEYVQRDSRIKVIFRKENGHISKSSNSAIELATGEYMALIDHDDELSEHALYLVAETINAHPEALVIYSDEDKIDEQGKRFDPYFKSDWNPDLFRGHNMISHLGIYKASVVKEIGGFRVGYEGSQDYDLALRITENAARHEVVHIPHVLYHWRAIAGSTALGPGEKNYAHIASRKALSAHLERIGLAGEFLEMPRFQGNWSFRLSLTSQPKISIIIPTRDGLDYLTRCINSIRQHSTYKNYEIIIVNNQSSEPEVFVWFDEQAAMPDTKVLHYDRPFNFSAINNFAATQAEGDLLLFLNNDTEVLTKEWLEEMAAHAMRPSVGAVGAMLYYPDDTVQHAGVVLGLGAAGIAGHSYHLKPRGYPGQMCRMHLVQEVSAVTAACLMMRRSVFEQVGRFDESYPVAFNDIDLCLRIRKAGYSIIWTPRAELYHFESVTRGSDADPERKARFDHECERFRNRWGNELRADPYFNPNLRLDVASFEFGPPRAPKPWKRPDYDFNISKNGSNS